MHTFKREDLEKMVSKSSFSSEVTVTKLPYRNPRKGSVETILYSIGAWNGFGGAQHLLEHFVGIAKENGFTPTFVLKGIPPCSYASEDNKTGILVTGGRNDQLEFNLNYYP